MGVCFSNHKDMKTTKSHVPTVTIVYLRHKSFKMCNFLPAQLSIRQTANSAVLSIQSKVRISLFVNPTVGYLKFACETAINEG